MSYLALAGAAAVGAGIGYTFGSNTKSNDGTGLTAEEKTEIGVRLSYSKSTV